MRSVVYTRYMHKAVFGGWERVFPTDLNYWIKLLSCIIEANGGHIGLSHINYIGTIEVVEEVFTGLGYWWEWINIV